MVTMLENRPKCTAKTILGKPKVLKLKFSDTIFGAVVASNDAIVIVKEHNELCRQEKGKKRQIRIKKSKSDHKKPKTQGTAAV